MKAVGLFPSLVTALLEATEAEIEKVTEASDAIDELISSLASLKPVKS